MRESRSVYCVFAIAVYRFVTTLNDFHADALLFRQAIVQYHQWSTMSAREVNQLQKDLAELENGLTVSDSTQQLRTELTNLRNKVRISFFFSLRDFL